MIIIKRQIKILLFFLVFIIVSPIIILYANGDILGNGWNILPTGGIYVTGAPISSSIFLNAKSKDTTSFFGRNFLIKSLKPGTYEVSVKKDNYNSWTEKISVSNNLVTDANIFMLPTKIELRAIPKYIVTENKSGIATTTTRTKNQEYADVSLLFSSVPAVVKQTFSTSSIDFKSNLGTEYSPIMIDKLGLWQKNGKIFIQWFGDEDSSPDYLCDQSNCSQTLMVYDNGSVPTEIGFLPGRNNAIIIASGNKIFAIQTQNYPSKVPQLIYQGTHPDFKINNGNIYLKDNGLLSEIVL